MSSPAGPAGEEAARLLAAAESWARSRVGGAEGWVRTRWVDVEAWARTRVDDEHLATGSAACLVCPWCQAVAAARQARPGTVEHLVDAAGSVLAAVRSLVGPQGSDTRPARPRVEHIDVREDQVGLAIGIDIGGTKVAAGVVDEHGLVLARTRRLTPGASAGEVERTIAEVVTELRRTHEVEAVGIGAAGFIDAERANVLFAPNLVWRDEPLRDEVARLVNLPVVVENDANAMAWGEYRFGAGRGEDHLVAVTVGTGIGGGIVLDGRLYRGRFGIGAEYGHVQVVRDGRRCGCGQRGCWEQYCSGRALLHEAREIADVQKTYGARLLELGGGRPEGITAPEVTLAAREGDPAAVACFAEIGRWLGEGLAGLAATLDPGRFVIGGGVSDAGELLLAPAREHFARCLTGTGHRPPAQIRLAELGNEAGLVGAADLARC